MNKKLLFFIPIFLFLFIPKNTFATTSFFYPERYMSVDVNNQSTVEPGNSYIYLGDYYQGFYSTASITTVDFIYNSNILDSSKLYDISFYITMRNTSIDLLSKPIVSFNDKSCTVIDAPFSSYSSGYSSLNLFAVSCQSVTVPSTGQFSVHAIGAVPIDTSNRFYAISRRFAVQESTTNAMFELNQSMKEQTEETKKNTEETKKQTETIKDSDTSEAGDSANSFFGDFKSDDYGLSDIVTMPLSFINGLSSGECNSLILPMPFVEQNVELPCMTSIYNKYFKSFLQLYQIITTGFIAYWICINIFRMVQNFKNPDNDEVEVLDL